MANQPTKYRKFVVGAASAALVASAVAPVASAKDFSDTKGNTHEAAIDALSDAGVISGYPDGSFQPNKTLTRSDVVKLMGKWLESEGYEAASDYKTNPRFADLTSASNEELLKYAALVKDNGLFVGTPDGKLDPAGNITRENMAIVLVRAFDRVHDIDLATYVAGQDFKKDVNDRATAKAEARPAIDVLDFFDITNPAAPAFNPKTTTTRGHFATFLHKFTNADFSDVAAGVVGDATVKAVNATTVEVTFKDEVENINSLNFTIEGLTVSNAAVKQSDNKTVVLTTAQQEGGKEYTVSVDNKEIGKFTGVSAVVPTDITVNTTSVQGKVGQQAILSADVGVKQAGIPVTFNVKANTTGTLNKDQVFEVVTDANGIATFSYTQYAAGVDQVAAYPTGAPAVRDLANVYWGVDNILTVTAQDEKGNSLNNGENKVYKVTYLDPATGKPVANQRLHVTLAENLNVNIDKTSKATVNGVNPMQLLNGTAPTVATITTDSKGEATFTVSGHNTTVTPVVFPNQVNNRTDVTTWEATKLQAKPAESVVFGALQADYTIDVERDGLEEAATGVENGREYNIVVKKKDGSVAAHEIVNLAFNEDLDRNMNTNTKAYFITEDADGNQIKDYRYDNDAKYTVVKTNAKGEASFVIGAGDAKEYATPIAWIDINTPNAREGKLDEGEPYKVAAISYFEAPKLVSGALKAAKTPAANSAAVKEFTGDTPAFFVFTAGNQSGKPYTLGSEYAEVDAEFTVFNEGANDVVVKVTGKRDQVVSPNRSYTVNVKGSTTPYIEVDSGNKTTSVRVVASGTAVPATYRGNTARPVNLGSQTATANFTATTEIGTIHTGIVTDINTTSKRITFQGKSAISYAGATYKNVNAVTLTMKEFEDLVKANEGTAKVTYKKDGDNVTFEIVSLNHDLTTLVDAINDATTVAQVEAALEKASITPDFAKLTATQKTAVASSVLTARNSAPGSILSSARLQTSYLSAYTTVTLAAVRAAATPAQTEAALAVVPGLNTSGLIGLTDTQKTTVLNAVGGNSYANVDALQTALNNAISSETESGAVTKINAAATNAEMLTALTDAGINLAAFNALVERPQALVLDSLVNAGTFTTINGVETALNTAIVANKADLTATVNGITLNTAGATQDTITITFNEDMDLTQAEVDAALASLTFDVGALGSSAAATINSSGDSIVITVNKGDHSVVAGSILTAIDVKDSFGVKVDLSKEAIRPGSATPVKHSLEVQ